MRDYNTFCFYGRELALKGEIFKYAIRKSIKGDNVEYYVAYKQGTSNYRQIGGTFSTFSEAYKMMICEEYDLIQDEWDYECDCLDNTIGTEGE